MPRHSALLATLLLVAACGGPRRPPLPRAEIAAPTPSTTPTVAPAVTPTPTSGAAPLSMAPPPPRSLLGAGLPPLTSAALRLVEQAAAQRASGDDAAAGESLERAVEIDPSCGFAYYDLAALHLDHGRNEQAIAFADKALVVGAAYGNDWLSHAQLLLGRALQAHGDNAAAADAYRRALALNAGNLPARIALQGLQ